MATSKLSGKDRASDKLLNRIAEHIDADRIQSIASDLDMKDSMFSRIKADFPGETQNQAFKVLKWGDESLAMLDTQAVVDKVREWKRKGYIDVDVFENIKEMVDIDLQTSQSDKILKNVHLRDISERITSASDLVDLGTLILGVSDPIIDSAMHNHVNDIHSASRKVLTFWLRQQTNRETAYTVLYESLRRNEWNQMAIELKQWVEG